MSYRIIGPTDQYAAMGAEAAISVDDLTDMDEAAVEEMLEEAEENTAYVYEGADGKSYVIQFPGRPVEVYSTSAIWRTFRTAWKKIA